MAPGIRLDDRGVWDDSALINSWDEAVAEYQKYHSISKSGKRLEEVLTTEELERLRGDHGDLMDKKDGSGANPTHNTDAADAALPEKQANDEGASGPSEVYAQRQDGVTPVKQGTAKAKGAEPPHGGSLPASMPQALLGSGQDENLKNLMMSWYYAGYYTGLVAGQQPPAPDNGSQQNQQ